MIERGTARKALSLALAAGLSLAAYNALDRETLNREQSAMINKDARLGRFGLEGYQKAIETGIAHTEQLGEIRSSGSSNIGKFPNKTVPLGESLITTDNLEGDYVPELDENASAHDKSVWKFDSAESRGSYITYKNTSGNMAYESKESAVFLNPDVNFFGDDHAASPAEVTAFFKDPRTESVELAYHNVDALNGETDYKHTSENGEIELELSVDTPYSDDLNIDSSSPNAVDVVEQKLFF